MEMMFCNAKNFNQPIGGWDTSKVTNMNSMFYNASNFNQPIEKWDVSNVNIIDMMFANPDEIEFDDELHTNQFEEP